MHTTLVRSRIAIARVRAVGVLSVIVFATHSFSSESVAESRWSCPACSSCRSQAWAACGPCAPYHRDVQRVP